MKYYGRIGYWLGDVETRPGYFEQGIVEKECYGEVLKYSKRWDANNEQINAGIKINNQFEIYADDFMREHLSSIRYITYVGSKWSVSDITVDWPRITITVGGEFNENTQH